MAWLSFDQPFITLTRSGSDDASKKGLKRLWKQLLRFGMSAAGILKALKAPCFARMDLLMHSPAKPHHFLGSNLRRCPGIGSIRLSSGRKYLKRLILSCIPPTFWYLCASSTNFRIARNCLCCNCTLNLSSTMETSIRCGATVYLSSFMLRHIGLRM